MRIVVERGEERLVGNICPPQPAQVVVGNRVVQDVVHEAPVDYHVHVALVGPDAVWGQEVVVPPVVVPPAMGILWSVSWL